MTRFYLDAMLGSLATYTPGRDSGPSPAVAPAVPMRPIHTQGRIHNAD